MVKAPLQTELKKKKIIFSVVIFFRMIKNLIFKFQSSLKIFYSNFEHVNCWTKD